MQNNRLVLVAAVIAGVTATGLAFAYLKRASLASGPAPTENFVEILATARDLPGNTKLEPDTDVQIIKVPEETFAQLAKASVKRNERASLRGRKIAGPLPSGTPLLYSHLAAVTDLAITPGSRALTIQVSEAGALGGLVVPGDRVDVVVSKKLKDPVTAMPGSNTPAVNAQGQVNPDYLQSMIAGAMQKGMSGGSGGEWEATVVLANVKVLAVGTSLQKSRSEMLFGQTTETVTGRSAGGTVTVEVTLDEALQLIKATAGANPVTLLLRTERNENP
ncbi:MAG: Flp pilus assembly protein CpaB [Phycisphaerales bacterium]|nr:Flp pilus assembly protein CpaB [Phycisphaerales bacterium]